MIQRQGTPLVVSAPSGGGKTTICRRVVAEMNGVEFSISHTTRTPRSHERDGVDYHFVDDAEFDRLVADNQFLEWAWVHGHRYGTARAWVEKHLDRGIDILFDIDVQGGRQIAERIPGTVLVCVVPPSMEVLKARLQGRATDSEDVIERRLFAAGNEIRSASFYTHWIVNDDIDAAVSSLRAIVVSERHRRLNRSALLEAVLGPA